MFLLVPQKISKYYISWLCVCSLSYPACQVHVPYCIDICALSGCTMFSTLSHKWHTFQKNLLNIKFVFLFFLQLLSETFLILRSTEWDIIINVHRSPWKVPVVVIVRFYWNSNFLDILFKNTQLSNFIGSQIVSRRQMDRQMTLGCYSQFCERA